MSLENLTGQSRDSFSDEEMQKLQEGNHELSDDDLDMVSGSCGCDCDGNNDPCYTYNTINC